MMFRKKIFEIIETGKKDNGLSKFYDRFMMMVIVVSIIPLFFKDNHFVLMIIDQVTALIFIIDYILRWITADFREKKHKIVSFIKYPLTFWAIIDIIAILPSITFLNDSFRLFKLFRLWKALKAIRILRYSKSFSVILDVIHQEKKPLLAVSNLTIGYIILAALVMFSAEPESFDTFFDAFYWAVVTLTTVGYGDIYPASIAGRIICMISSFMGIAIVALPTGIITAGYMNALNRYDKKNNNETDCDETDSKEKSESDSTSESSDLKTE